MTIWRNKESFDEITILCAAHLLSVNQIQKSKQTITQILLISSCFSNIRNNIITRLLRKILSMFSLSLFFYQVQRAWFYQSNFSTKTFQASQI